MGEGDVLTIPNPDRPVLRRQALGWASALLLLAGAGNAAAQAYTPPPPPLTSAPCVPTKKDPCTIPASDQPPPPAPAAKFPYPGDVPAQGTAAEKFPFPGEAPATAPAAAAAAPASGGAASKFPYPGEPLAPLAAPAGDASASSSSSSSSATPDAADNPAPRAPVKPAARTGRRPLPKVENLSEREAEDLEVSKFYIQTSNYLGAYNRAKDALKIMPEDSEAHWSLAVAAQKMKKPDEAIAEYTSYLKAEPEGDHVAAARLALHQLTGR